MIKCEEIENPITAFAEIAALLQAHKEELCVFDQVDLDVDWKSYTRMAECGLFQLVTARNEQDKLVGYCANMIVRHLHYDIRMALNDVLYLKPDYRGHGIRLIKFVEKCLIAKGVQVFSISIKPHVDFSPVVERFGYNILETNYWRRLI